MSRRLDTVLLNFGLNFVPRMAPAIPGDLMIRALCSICSISYLFGGDKDEGDNVVVDNDDVDPDDNNVDVDDDDDEDDDEEEKEQEGENLCLLFCCCFAV